MVKKRELNKENHRNEVGEGRNCVVDDIDWVLNNTTAPPIMLL